MKLMWMAAAIAGAALAQDPLTADARQVWNGLKNNILKAADKMPEEHYGFKPAPEVRSYGQIVAHIADGNYMICAAAKGEKRPPEIEKTKSGKADIVTALQESVKYCDSAYEALTDAKGAETVKFFGRDRTRLGTLNFNMGHDYEHYGNLVTYLRMKGIVPPSSEPRKPQ